MDLFSCAVRLSGLLLAGPLMAGLLFGSPAALPAAEGPLTLTARSQVETAEGSGRYHRVTQTEEWAPQKSAVIVCDVWDLHHCLNAVRRETEFAPRLNEVLTNLRGRGFTVIHAPSDCMEAYADHPARKRAIETPKAAHLPADITAWCNRIPAEEQGKYPIDQSDGGEDDDPAEHAEWAAKLAGMGRNPKAPWKSQLDVITIDPERDYISDKGDEVWSILEQQGITNVILTGVHTNMCVLGRPFGLRQLAKNGKNVVLMRDMTDTMYNPQMWPYVSHFTGTDLIVSHIEKYVCPTITSDQVIGGEPFRFSGDMRPHLVIVSAEDEYETERTLPEFAAKYLGKAFRVSFVFADETLANSLPGVEVIDSADLLLVSVRRRPLLPEQMAVFRRYVDAGRPVVGIRTASHAFSLRTDPPPAGVEEWREFDPQVFGGHYTNHYGNALQTTATIDARQQGHPILTGIRADPFPVGGSLYKVSPIDETATVLMTGEVEGEAPEPLAYTFTRSDGGRSFYTSLGYKTDFDGNPDFQRLLVNALYWAAGLDVPAEFQVVGTIDDYRRHWMPLPVPGGWDALSQGVLKDYAGPAWYRCAVRMPAGWRSRTDAGAVVSLEASGAAADVYWNGANVRTSGNGLATRCAIPDGAIDFEDVNLLAIRVADRKGLTAAPVLSLCEPGQSSTSAASAPSAAISEMALAGTWQFRIGDDPLFATLPLPAKFAVATDVVIESAAPAPVER